MLSLILLATVTPVATPLAPPSLCEWQMRHARRSENKGGIRKLGDLPPANEVLTVYRRVDGCPKPVIVRRDIGVK